MNCLDCRRQLLTEPGAHTPALRAHLRECPACDRFAREHAVFERDLEAALRVPTPENLRERVVFAASLSRPRFWRRIAAAAVLVFGVGLGLGGWEYAAKQRLTDDLSTHIAADPLHEQPSDARAPLQLKRLVTGLGAHLDAAQLGEIVHAHWCQIGHRNGAHFVIERGARRASAFMLPGARLAMEHWVRAGNLHGVLIPTGGGVIAVFCPDRKMLSRLVEDMRHTVSWRV